MKRTNWVMWGLALLTAALVCASGLLTPYLRIYRDRQTWDDFIEAARRGDYQFVVSIYVIAVTVLLFLGLDLWRSKERWSTLTPEEQRRRQWNLVIAAPGLVALLVLVGVLVLSISR